MPSAWTCSASLMFTSSCTVCEVTGSGKRCAFICFLFFCSRPNTWQACVLSVKPSLMTDTHHGCLSACSVVKRILGFFCNMLRMKSLAADKHGEVNARWGKSVQPSTELHCLGQFFRFVRAGRRHSDLYQIQRYRPRRGSQTHTAPSWSWRRVGSRCLHKREGNHRVCKKGAIINIYIYTYIYSCNNVK